MRTGTRVVFSYFSRTRGHTYIEGKKLVACRRIGRDSGIRFDARAPGPVDQRRVGD
jgi:hypothetical protein